MRVPLDAVGMDRVDGRFVARESRARAAALTLTVARTLLAVSVAGLCGVAHARRADLPAVIEVVADRDDDDLNGVPDGAETFAATAARVDTIPLDAFVGITLTPESGGEHARILVAGRPFAWGKRVPRGAVVQGLTPGLVVLAATGGLATSPVTLSVTAVGFRDGQGHDVDFTRSHASLDRSPPSQVTGDASSPYEAPDPLRVFVVTPYDTAPSLGVESVSPTGAHLDALSAPALASVPCGGVADDQHAALHCFASEPIRFVIDDVDRRHALSAGRSIRAELGGAIVLRRDGRKEQAIRVLGPRDSPAGPIGRLRATAHAFAVRLSPGGAPSIGGSDAGAVLALRAELATAAAAWGECGITFGPPEEIVARVVDPPPAHLLAIGDDLGLPASGGHVRVRVDGRKVIDVVAHPGELPIGVARRVAREIERAGFVAVVSPNARVSSGANPSVDVSVRSRSGALVPLEPVDPTGPLTDDASLTVRIGSVDLADGLAHFGDFDSVAGTLEERTLLKALGDGDPSTIDVVIIPFFTGGGRIGESFIGTDRSSLRNVVLLDRAGIRARRSSLTLAHELGHVLLDVPGHPDDYGVDTPTRLMDADAADASPFGPRRLTLAECARVVRESGPGARSPILREWPLSPLTYVDTPLR